MMDQLALQAAAVLGHRAPLEPLRRMIRDETWEPTRLVDAALVRFDGEEIEFAHALFRDAIYESTLKSKRRELHCAAAECFVQADAALYADHLALKRKRLLALTCAPPASHARDCSRMPAKARRREPCALGPMRCARIVSA